MTSPRSNDVLEQFIEGLFVLPKKPVTRKPGGGAEAAKESRFIPVSLIPAPPTGLVFAQPWLSTSVAEHPLIASKLDTPLRVLAEAGHWLPALIAASATVVTLDCVRYAAWRHRIALIRQTFATTGALPKSVHISVPPGLLTVRKAAVNMRRGTVINARKLDELTNAVDKAAGDRWQMSVDWQAHRNQLLITRQRYEEDLAKTSKHASVLGEALVRSPLVDARIAEFINDEKHGDEAGYVITHAPALALGRATVQQTMREAILAHLAPHESGRLWTVSFYPERKSIEVRLTAPLPTFVPHVPLPDYSGLSEVERLRVPFATGPAATDLKTTAQLDALGRILVVWDMSWKSNAPHALFAGPTGGGKTSTIRTAVTEAIKRGIPALLIDPKMIELNGMEGYPGVVAVVYRLREIVELIVGVYQEMMARAEFVHRYRIPNTSLQVFCVIMDEFFIMSALIQRAVKYSGGDKAQENLAEYVRDQDVLGKLAQIMALIRSLGGRVGQGVQQPAARNYGEDGTSVRDNFGTRASHSNLSAQGSLMMWGDSEVGRDLDTSIPGRIYATGPTGQPIQAQVHWTPDMDRHPNKWNLLSERDRAIVEALIPDEDVVMTCYSKEFAVWLAKRGYDPDIPVVPDTGQPLYDLAGITVSLHKSGEPESDLVDVEAVDDAVAASSLKVGDVIHVADPETGQNVTGTVAARRRKKGGPVIVDLQSSGRARLQIEFEPDELVLIGPEDAESPAAEGEDESQ